MEERTRVSRGTSWGCNSWWLPCICPTHSGVWENKRTRDKQNRGATEKEWGSIVGCVITVVMNCGPCANSFIITSNLYPLRVIRGLCFNMVVGWICPCWVCRSAGLCKPLTTFLSGCERNKVTIVSEIRVRYSDTHWPNRGVWCEMLGVKDVSALSRWKAAAYVLCRGWQILTWMCPVCGQSWCSEWGKAWYLLMSICLTDKAQWTESEKERDDEPFLNVITMIYRRIFIYVIDSFIRHLFDKINEEISDIFCVG